VSSIHPIEGTISAPVSRSEDSGRISRPVEHHHHHHGALRGAPPPGELEPGAPETPESAAIAELNGLIATLSSLSSQAQSLPMQPPAFQGLPQGGYKPQRTDYTQFSDSSN
jgi:hypothetical protein